MKILLFVLTTIVTIAFLAMVAICITISLDYHGKEMGNEAHGFFSAAVLLSLLLFIPTAILWATLISKVKKKAP